jgi:hypothetical protein
MSVNVKIKNNSIETVVFRYITQNNRLTEKKSINSDLSLINNKL